MISGCGKGGSDESVKGPATAEQAARVLDLSTIALVDGGVPPWPRGIASLSYPVKSDPKTAFEFYRKKLLTEGWKELPNSSVTSQGASGTFSRAGFVVSISAFPAGDPGMVQLVLQNHGNVKLDRLPVPPGAKPVYVGDVTAMYVTDGAVPAAAEAVHKLLLAEGWTPYGSAGNSSYYKQNAVRIGVTVASAPAQGGKTMISYISELMSADLPVPPDADELQYADSTKELRFETAADKNLVVDFYKKTLAENGWAPTLEKMVQVGDNDEMIFRNPAKDMLTLSMPARPSGKIPISLQQQSAAEIAELDREMKEHAQKLKR